MHLFYNTETILSIKLFKFFFLLHTRFCAKKSFTEKTCRQNLTFRVYNIVYVEFLQKKK